MLHKLKKLFQAKIKPLNYIHISKKNILHNYKILQKQQKNSEIFPVLKSNAYGHGMKEVCEILKDTDVKMVCVDSFPEYQIAKTYFGKKVLILGETRKENYKYYDFKTASFGIYNIETLQYLVSLNKKINIHLALNTGMNREGFSEENIKEALELIQESKINIEGVSSHFSSAGEYSFKISQKQINIYKELYLMIVFYGFDPQYRHIGATSGIFRVQDDFFNAFRSGIGIFGGNPVEKKCKEYKEAEKLKLCMDIYATVINIQDVKKGEGVGYNFSYQTLKNTKIATISFGYFEGYSRKLSNNFIVKIKNKFYPVVGKICMNMSMIDIGNAKVQLGDEVQVLSKDLKDGNNILNFAKNSDSTMYESYVKIHQNTRKEII